MISDFEVGYAGNTRKFTGTCLQDVASQIAGKARYKMVTYKDAGHLEVFSPVPGHDSSYRIVKIDKE
jgi:hypothetical protein